MEGRNHVFQRLKPSCVALSQAALAMNGPTANVRLLTDRLEDLKNVLSSIVAKQYALDERLADYVFFPLSQVFRASQKVSIRCLELALQCLCILIDKGWSSRIQSPLATQVLILCSLLAQQKPEGLAFAVTTEELRTRALSCLCNLFSVLDTGCETSSVLTSEGNFPQLGQTISTILDAILDGHSVETQVAAINTLQALLKNVVNLETQANFLPGIASKLTKVLTSQTEQRRNYLVLVGALNVLAMLLQNTLTRNSVETTEPHPASRSSLIVNSQWIQTAASQLKPALTGILSLKGHSRLEVRVAVSQLCFVIIKKCRHALESCAPLALETLLLLASEQSGDSIMFELEVLIGADKMVLSLAQGTLYGWLQSLPTDMQAADLHAKLQRIHQIRTAYILMHSGSGDMNTIDRMLSTALRDSIAIAIQSTASKQQSGLIPPVQSVDLALFQRNNTSMEFETPFTKSRGQEQVTHAIEELLKASKTLSTSAAFCNDMARALRQTQGEMQLATFWLLFSAAQEDWSSQNEVDAFLDLGGGSSHAYAKYLEDMYSFSLEVLSETSNNYADPRFKALALRTLGLQARIAGTEFRFELIDVLYPVLHTLATPDETLQRDSLTALNIFTQACGYGSVKDLIVENVDYLINAVAMKLNAFDVSPQAPQVLLMMVRLAGPSILPYLEDTVDSIFAALENYHGYPLLVELLFRVLSVIAEEGAKAPQLAITGGLSERSVQELHCHLQPMRTSSLTDLLKEKLVESSWSGSRAERIQLSHPKRPWKRVEDTDNDNDRDDPGTLPDCDEFVDNELPDEVVSTPPLPKTYTLLIKISELTQHFLPSTSASLRTSLLGLIKKTIPAIARHEDSFLPLINTLWPEIVSRLEDNEPQVVAGALDIIGILCEHARDFMRSRIAQLWPRLVEIWWETANNIMRVTTPTNRSQMSAKDADSLAIVSQSLKQTISRMRSAPFDHSDTSVRYVWSSLIFAIIAAVQYTSLPPDDFDDALDMMSPLLEDENIRSTFEHVNADAVWLIRVRSTTVPSPKPPIATYVAFASVSG